MSVKIEVFDKNIHTKPLWELAQKNNFYLNEVKGELFENLSEEISYNRLLIIDDKLVGWICWSVDVIKKINIKKCYLKYILIDVEYDRKGYGTLLLNEYINWSRNNAKTQLIANVGDGFTNVENFYKKNGFKMKKQGFSFNTWVKNIRHLKK